MRLRFNLGVYRENWPMSHLYRLVPNCNKWWINFFVLTSYHFPVVSFLLNTLCLPTYTAYVEPLTCMLPLAYSANECIHYAICAIVHVTYMYVCISWNYQWEVWHHWNKSTFHATIQNERGDRNVPKLLFGSGPSLVSCFPGPPQDFQTLYLISSA